MGLVVAIQTESLIPIMCSFHDGVMQMSEMLTAYACPWRPDSPPIQANSILSAEE